jgi:hypothetical protein
MSRWKTIKREFFITRFPAGRPLQSDSGQTGVNPFTGAIPDSFPLEGEKQISPIQGRRIGIVWPLKKNAKRSKKAKECKTGDREATRNPIVHGKETTS